MKNIVIIGAGYGGITAALHLASLLKKHVFFETHLVDKSRFHTIKTQLYEAEVRKAEIQIPLYRLLKNKNIQLHYGDVKSIDIENKTVQINDRLMPYQFLIIAMGSKVNYKNITGMKENASQCVVGRVLVNENLEIENNKHSYAIGKSANIINPVTEKTVSADQFVFQQGRSAAENIYAEIFGKSKKPCCPKVVDEVVSFGKHLAVNWLALPIFKKVIFVGFLGSLIKTAIKEKHISLLRKESRKWITC